MADFQTYVNALLLLFPFFSAAACMTMIGFSLQDCLTMEERKLKSIVMCYFTIMILAWFTVFCYFFLYEVFIYISVIFFISIFLVPVFFYRIIRFLTRPKLAENFSLWHYFVPGVIAIALSVWLLFFPFSVHFEIVRSKDMTLSVNYTYTLIFFLARMIFVTVYSCLVYVQLKRYYRWANEVENLVRLPAHWVLFIIALSLATIFAALIASFLPRNSMFNSVWVVIAEFGMVGQYILLTSHIIRRKYLFYTTICAETQADEKAVTFDKSGRRIFSGKLTRERFEEWFHSQKPYLNANFRIADAVEAMDVNRSFISAFVNKTYGMNFNRYVNRWRIKEFERLSSLPENEGSSKLFAQAGFNELRQYHRAVAAERESITN